MLNLSPFFFFFNPDVHQARQRPQSAGYVLFLFFSSDYCSSSSSSKRLLLPLIGYYGIIKRVSIVNMSKENKVNNYKKMN